LVEADAQDQVFFGRADGAEAAEEILEEDQELAGIFVVDQVAVGAGWAGDAVAGGCGFAFGGFRTARFFAFWRLALIWASVGMGATSASIQ
jgi:hypothetical protein